tara:strand:+ start:263482 stop:264465 length:984 start_codon:yes stop_codon:yes gene_type:complete
MIGLVLGLIIIGGAISVYLASKRSLTEVEQVSALSENGRFALQLITTSARHIGFFGGANPADITQDSELGSVEPGKDCSGNAGVWDTDNSFFAVRAAGASVLTCITDAVPQTDVLVIKGVAPSPEYDADPDDPDAERDGLFSFPDPNGLNPLETYVVSNGESGVLLDGADTPPTVSEGGDIPFGVAWPYQFQIYYISDGTLRNDGVPTLSRMILGWNGALRTVITQDLVQGVENMRFLFGYDSANAGEVDTLGSLADVTAANAWDRVSSIQAFILVRSDVADPNYVNDKSYQLGDLAPITPGDNFRRILLQSQIVMRNPRLVLRGEA